MSISYSHADEAEHASLCEALGRQDIRDLLTASKAVLRNFDRMDWNTMNKDVDRLRRAVSDMENFDAP